MTESVTQPQFFSEQQHQSTLHNESDPSAVVPAVAATAASITNHNNNPDNNNAANVADIATTSSETPSEVQQLPPLVLNLQQVTL